MNLVVSYDDLMRESHPIDLSAFPPPPIVKLKDMSIDTVLISDGKPRATIVIDGNGKYAMLAERIQGGIKEATGTELPIMRDSQIQLPFQENLIILGNRCTNAVIEKLYNLYYAYLDLRYPGIGGYEVRSLHNPFGNGFNAILVGSSNDHGMSEAVDELMRIVSQAARTDSLVLGWVMRIRLGSGKVPPENANDCPSWEDCVGYKPGTYFGWNSISRNMALYYMTADEKFANEFLRLTQPDAKAIEEMWSLDGERIEDKNRPLSGPYHYNAHLMILLWDLIEESPLLTDEQRLRITQAFAEQLRHWQAEEWCYAGKRFGDPKAVVGSRHDQYQALSLYCLARYFCKYYPHIVWQRNLEAAQYLFSSLSRSAQLAGELDHLWWLSTGLEPVMSYMLIGDDSRALESGVLQAVLRAYDAIISCEHDDEHLRYQSISFAHKATYLIGDNRFLYYRNLTNLDLSIFRIGQSFLPVEDLERRPTELANRIVVAPIQIERWHVHPEQMYPYRCPVSTPIPYEQAFRFLSYRTGVTEKDDYLMIDGFNEGVVNPYHCFAIYKLRINDKILLHGYLNEFILRHGGLTEHSIPIASALKVQNVFGDVAHIEAEVPNFSFGSWLRRILHVARSWTLVIDEFVPNRNLDDLEMTTQWQLPSSPQVIDDMWLEYPTGSARAAIVPWEHSFLKVIEGIRKEDTPQSRMMLHVTNDVAQSIVRARAKSGNTFRIMTLLGLQPAEGELRCSKLNDQAALIETPELTLAAIGSVEISGSQVRIQAEVALIGENFIYASNAHRITIGIPILEAPEPITLFWNLSSGELDLFCDEPAALGMAVCSGGMLLVDNHHAQVTHAVGDVVWIRLERGQHRITGAISNATTTLKEQLNRLRERTSGPPSCVTVAERFATLPQLRTISAVQIDGPAKRVLPGPVRGGSSCAYIISERDAYLLSANGKLEKRIELETKIMSAAYWQEVDLLLLGGSNDVVYAFNGEGELRWAFRSEMDPDVQKTGKTYWFKDALPGVRGLATGSLTSGRTQAFVGSACTIEVLDPDGDLVKRLPQFWGCCVVMNVVAKSDGSRKLLVSKWPNGVNDIGVIDGQDWSITYAYTALPEGHTRIPDWTAMDTPHILVDDINGDGKMEVILDVNGSWNYLCVYDADFKPLWALSFGPSLLPPHRHMRDLQVADIDGDGLKEIIVATENGTVSAFSHDGRRKWFVDGAPPTCLCIVRERSASKLAIGHEDGTILVLDAAGRAISRSKLNGSIQALHALDSLEAGMVAGTSQGKVEILRL